jgi:hypothetical protein
VAERAEVRQPAVRGVAVELRRCKHDTAHPELSGPHKAGPLGHAPLASTRSLRLVEPPSVQQAAAEGGVWSATGLAPIFGKSFGRTLCPDPDTLAMYHAGHVCRPGRRASCREPAAWLWRQSAWGACWSAYPLIGAIHGSKWCSGVQWSSQSHEAAKPNGS